MTWNLFCDRSKRREDWERSIFVRLKEGGFRLRENILFHLYVSTSPCGDARLHSPYEITTDCKETPSPLPFLLCMCFVAFWFRFLFYFFLRSFLLSFFAGESVSLESKNTTGFRECVSVCLWNWLLVLCAGEISAGQDSSPHLGLHGSAGEYITAFPA